MGNPDQLTRAVAARDELVERILAALPVQDEFRPMQASDFMRAKTDFSTVHGVSRTLAALGIIERKQSRSGTGFTMRWARVVSEGEARARWAKHTERYLAKLEPIDLGSTDYGHKTERKRNKTDHDEFKPTTSVKLGSGPNGAAEPVTITVADEAAEGKDEKSDKETNRVLVRIVENGPFATTMDLIRAARRQPGEIINPHGLTHRLYSLSRRGLIEFKLQKMGSSEVPTVIKATERAYKQLGYPNGVALGSAASRHREAAKHAGDRTDFRTHAARAEGGPVERVGVPATPEVAPSPFVVAPRQEDVTLRDVLERPDVPVAEAPVPAELPSPPQEQQEVPVAVAPPTAPATPPYPRLAELLGRKGRAEARAALIEQAAMLSDSETERDWLLTKAAETLELFYTETEAEYMRYAAEHE